MKCNEIRELMPDLAAGLNAVTPEMKSHLDSCAECAGKLEAFRQTMSLLDEWQAPEPSPYFDVRLRARLREELQQRASGLLPAARAARSLPPPSAQHRAHRKCVRFPHPARRC